MANACQDPYAAVNLLAACSGLGKTALALASSSTFRDVLA
jgi:hypothetical protein